jgi:peptidyl-dipeptidase A
VRIPVWHSVCVVAGLLIAFTVAAAETSHDFVSRVNRELDALSREVAQADWVQSTYITPDTQAISARANDAYLAYFNETVEASKRYAGLSLDAADARALKLLRLGVSSPAPQDPAQRAELTRLSSGLKAAFSSAKYCLNGNERCLSVDELGELMAKSRDYAELEKIWVGWHDTAAPMRADYARFVELANAGARELGFADMGAMWRSKYDMAPAEFQAEAERLWRQVQPLYVALHCYTRTRLGQRYGIDRVRPGEPIPAQLLGNMWAQQWNRIYDDLLKPFPEASIESADAALTKQQWDAQRMARSAEGFYTSLGFPALPGSFWERSMLTRPRDRDVVCHASAWNMDGRDDVRIKMCMQATEEDLFTIYHELGHVYYYVSYREQPYLFRSGAHDGFHEAIGDTVNLSVTPEYLAGIGLVRPVQPSREAVINAQMKMALEKIAFLPFGKVVDEWRWKVFSGEIRPADYNRTWWELRRRYQGIAPPVARDESSFDPGAKYHVAANVPYTRYFLSFILQFQMHKALCAAAGFKGPLHECSIYGNAEAGRRLRTLLAAGASQPWPDTLEQLTGTRRMDAAAIIEYFQPLERWLARQNRGQRCGWQ